MCVSQGKRCKCFWMDKKATNIQLQDNGSVTYKIGTFEHQIETNLDFEPDQPFKIFTVFESMSYLVVSDLAAMFALMGRETIQPTSASSVILRFPNGKKIKTR